MMIPGELIGWHGHGETNIIQQNEDGKNIILDLSTWIDKNGLGEWKRGTKIKKEFPPHILIFENLRWNKKKQCNECDDITIAKGNIKGNKFHGKLFSPTIFCMNKIQIAFTHKVKQIKNKHDIYITPERYKDKELQQIIEIVKNNNII